MKTGGVLENSFSEKQLTISVTAKIKTEQTKTTDEPVVVSLFDEDEEQETYLDKLKALQESMKAAKSGLPDPEEIAKTAKKQMLDGMIKTIQLLQPEMYTKDSWKSCMNAYKTALIALAKSDATVSSLNKAVNLLRSGLGKLEAALAEDEVGSQLDKRRAEIEAEQQAMVEQAKADANALMADVGEGVAVVPATTATTTVAVPTATTADVASLLQTIA